MEDHNFRRIPSMKEIWYANDGFTGYFYRSCWDIFQGDSYGLVINFFKGTYLPRDISATTLVLILKTQNAPHVGDFCPITLGNFSGKIISKIFSFTLAKLLSQLVYEEQTGFVRGGSTSTHIVLAHELIQDLHRKMHGANLVVKLDMTKAYDHLEWRFLLRAMEAFGFSSTSRDLIYRNICNIWYQFRINN